MRHAISKAGHEVLPLLFMLVATGTGVLFYLGNFWPGTPPGWIIIPVLVTLAICTEWLTFTFNQDMQDAFTARRGRGFPVVRALIASIVSAFIFATASSGLWAPRGASDKVLWAWILAGGVFASQFLLKLVPEKSKSPRSMQNIGAAIEEWMPSASVEEQADMAVRVYGAVAGKAPAVIEAQKAALPEPRPNLTIENSRRPAQQLVRREAWSNDDAEQPVEDEDGTADEQDSRVQRPRYTAPTPARRHIEPAADNLQLTIEALTEDPDITDEELADQLSLKRPASARYWRLKVQELLARHQPQPTPTRPSQEQQPRSRQEIIDEFREFAQAVQADTGFDLMGAVQQALSKSKRPAPEQMGTTSLAAPGKTEAEPEMEQVPFPGVRIPGTNHHQQEAAGVYERMGSVEGEGGDGDDTSFRQSTN